MKGHILVNGQTVTLPASVYEPFVPGFPKTSASLKKLMPKYNFSRAKWYVAEFDEKHYWEVEQWCSEQFGPHPKRPDAWSRWMHKYEDKIHFRDEKDYHWFVLRWGA